MTNSIILLLSDFLYQYRLCDKISPNIKIISQKLHFSFKEPFIESNLNFITILCFTANFKDV